MVRRRSDYSEYGSCEIPLLFDEIKDYNKIVLIIILFYTHFEIITMFICHATYTFYRRLFKTISKVLCSFGDIIL